MSYPDWVVEDGVMATTIQSHINSFMDRAMMKDVTIGEPMKKFMLVKDVWPQIAKLLNIADARIGGGVTIHLKQGDIVRVDILGMMPTPSSVNVTELTDEIETHAPIT